MSEQKAPYMPWQDRFIRHEIAPAGELLANPFNFRIHTRQQQAALEGSLETLQWIGAVKVNVTTGHIVDGHLRVTLALRKGENTGVPVDYYELTEAEEAQALLSLDPIAAMAATDKEQMETLLRQVNSDDEKVQEYLAELAEREGLSNTSPEFKEYGENIADDIQVCECPTCGHKHAAKKD